jgi:hypothetical protein
MGCCEEFYSGITKRQLKDLQLVKVIGETHISSLSQEIMNFHPVLGEQKCNRVASRGIPSAYKPALELCLCRLA